MCWPCAVSLSEFMNQSRRHPLVLSSLDSLFQVNRNNESGVLPSRITFTTHSLQARMAAAGGDAEANAPGELTETRRRALLGRFAAPPTPRSDERPTWNSSGPTPRVYGAKSKPARGPRKKRRPRTSPAIAATRHSNGTTSTPVLPSTTGLRDQVLSSPKRQDRSFSAWKAGGGVAASPSRFEASAMKRTPSAANLKSKLPLDVVGAHLTRTASRLAFGLQKKEEERRHKAMKDAAVASALRRIQSKPRNKLTLEGQDLSTYMDLQPGLLRRRKQKQKQRHGKRHTTPTATTRGSRQRASLGGGATPTSAAGQRAGAGSSGAPEATDGAARSGHRRSSEGAGDGAHGAAAAELGTGEGVVQAHNGDVSRVMVSPIRAGTAGASGVPARGTPSKLAHVNGRQRPRTTPTHTRRTQRLSAGSRQQPSPVAKAAKGSPHGARAGEQGATRTKAVRHNRYR